MELHSTRSKSCYNSLIRVKYARKSELDNENYHAVKTILKELLEEEKYKSIGSLLEITNLCKKKIKQLLLTNKNLKKMEESELMRI